MQLPVDFQTKMRQLLQDEYEAFLRSFQEEKHSGLRVNTLKIETESFLKLSPFRLEPVPWAKTGFYYDENDRPGKHPYHEAGLYYIQEPSAMAVAEIASPRPGEKVLDLCAAPGGKTTHLASFMKQEGLLVANEIHPARAKALSQNVERMGIQNVVVTSEPPDRLAARFPEYFDCVLVDAPCSGEGMFRKNPQACEEWSLDHVQLCAMRQHDILKHAADMLRPGGKLVYSTCTFSPEENEQVISAFVKEHSDFEIETVNTYEGFDHGRADWTSAPADSIERTVRIWPHRQRGEGHYIALLRKNGGDSKQRWKKHAAANAKVNSSALKAYYEFAEEHLNETLEGRFALFSDELYIVPDDMLSMDRLKVLRAGLHLGTLKKNRFEPSHALALALRRDQAKRSFNFQPESPEMKAYLRGESLAADGDKGWHLILADGYSIGWAKLAGGMLKNHYPKGLRWF